MRLKLPLPTRWAIAARLCDRDLMQSIQRFPNECFVCVVGLVGVVVEQVIAAVNSTIDSLGGMKKLKISSEVAGAKVAEGRYARGPRDIFPQCFDSYCATDQQSRNC